MQKHNITELTSQLQTLFGSNTNVLSFKTLIHRLNNGKTRHTNGYVTSKQLSSILYSSECFTRVNPQTVGSSKWFEKQNDSRKKKDKIRKPISLWKCVTITT